MRFCYDNKFLTASISANSENPNYLAENMQNTVLAKTYRSLLSSTIIKISTTIKASYIFLLNHNLTETATITLEGNNSDSWGSPSFSKTLIWRSDMCYLNFDESTYNFWRIVLSDTDTSSDGYIEIGSVFLGTYLQGPGVSLDQNLNKKTESNISISYSGQAYGEERYLYRVPTFNFPFLTHDERKSIDIMWNNNKNIKPLIVLVWAEDLDMESPMYCVIDQNEMSFKRNGDSRDPWSVKIKFREVF